MPARPAPDFGAFLRGFSQTYIPRVQAQFEAEAKLRMADILAQREREEVETERTRRLGALEGVRQREISTGLPEREREALRGITQREIAAPLSAEDVELGITEKERNALLQVRLEEVETGQPHPGLGRPTAGPFAPAARENLRSILSQRGLPQEQEEQFGRARLGI